MHNINENIAVDRNNNVCTQLLGSQLTLSTAAVVGGKFFVVEVGYGKNPTRAVILSRHHNIMHYAFILHRSRNASLQTEGGGGNALATISVDAVDGELISAASRLQTASSLMGTEEQ